MITPLVQGRSLRFPDHEITWAGECPWTGGFSFGTESGEVLICREDGQDELDVLKLSEEAVNDVAFWRDYVCVSTRSDVTIARRTPSNDGIIRLRRIPGGAHGVLATHGGHFFAPMGTSGLLRIDPERIDNNYHGVTIDEPSHATINFYKLINLGTSAHDELLACAARTSGLLMIGSNGDKPLQITGIVSNSADFIDVCSVASPSWPHTVVGLTLDRTLVFIRDPFADETPETLRLEELRGTPYAIFSANGRLLVLTSEELVAFPDLLNWYLRGKSLDRPFRYRYTPIRAVDAYLAYGKHLMVVMDEEVRLFEFPRLGQAMDDQAPENGHGDLAEWSEAEQSPSMVQPVWESLSLTV